MSTARLPIRDASACHDVDVQVADLSRLPTVWPTYQRGLYEVYSEIGAGDLAAGPELPTEVAAVVVASTPDNEFAGGIMLRGRSEIAQYAGIAPVAAAIAERMPDGVNEVGGCWIRPAWRGAGLGGALVHEIVKAAAGTRWTVALANQFSIGASVRAGFVPDPRLRDLPFPDNRFRSTLCWFDHGEGQ